MSDVQILEGSSGYVFEEAKHNPAPKVQIQGRRPWPGGHAEQLGAAWGRGAGLRRRERKLCESQGGRPYTQIDIFSGV